MENTEFVEATAEEITTSGKTLALTLVAATAVGVGVAFVANRVMKKIQAKAAEKELQNEAEEAAQN
jgi:mannose/fructose/N-acetylgalactosamine-specific phosphotransferase system component IIC